MHVKGWQRTDWIWSFVPSDSHQTLGFVNRPKALELPMCFSYQCLWQNVWCCAPYVPGLYGHWGCPLLWTVCRMSYDSSDPRHLCGRWKPVAWRLRRPWLTVKGGSILQSNGFVTSCLGLSQCSTRSLGIVFSVPLFLLPGSVNNNQNKTYVLL